jgi:molybdopterin-biosynthesis enzyme MoeA-like protein
MRKRMARVPHGAALIKNSVSTAPGFHIGNVFVLAGVPAIARAMLDALAPLLPRGPVVHCVTIAADIGEGMVAEGLAAIQKAHPDVAIGSYPHFRGPGGFGVQLVARSRDAAAVESSASEIETLLRKLGVAPQRVNPAGQ